MRCDDLCDPIQAHARGHDDHVKLKTRHNSARDVLGHVRGALHVMCRVFFVALSGRCSPTPNHLTAPVERSETNMYWRCVG